jgi:hypothetical protein
VCTQEDRGGGKERRIMAKNEGKAQQSSFSSLLAKSFISCEIKLEVDSYDSSQKNPVLIIASSPTPRSGQVKLIQTFPPLNPRVVRMNFCCLVFKSDEMKYPRSLLHNVSDAPPDTG